MTSLTQEQKTENHNKLMAFLASPDVKRILAQFKQINCHPCNIDESKHTPIYINLDIENSTDTPFLGIFEADQMVDGKVDLWVGIDDDKLNDGIDWQNHPLALANLIKEKTNTTTVTELARFCELAFKLREVADKFNNPLQTMPKVKIKSISTVSFMDVLRTLQICEWTSLGLEPPEKCQNINLPDGREDIFHRLWDAISSKRKGNQTFCNDTVFVFTFPTINGEPLTEDLQALYDYCKDAIVNETLYFEVCW